MLDHTRARAGATCWITHEHAQVPHAGSHTSTRRYHMLDHGAAVLNGCFSNAKYEMAPNAMDNWNRSHAAITTQKVTLRS